MALTYPLRAGNQSQDATLRVQPFAGEAPIITDSAPALAGIAYLQACALTPTGITPYVDATHNKSQLVIAAATTTIGQRTPYYDAGKFNHEAVTWPAEYNTWQKRQAFVSGTMIKVGHLKPDA
jgi:hypothetical protein